MDDMNEKEDRERMHLGSEVSVTIFLRRGIVEEIISSSACQSGSTTLQTSSNGPAMMTMISVFL
jgi:hypothetical protein